MKKQNNIHNSIYQTQMKTSCVFVPSIHHLPADLSTTDTGGEQL